MKNSELPVNEISAETKIDELSAKVDALVLGCKAGGVAILFLLSLINVGDTFAISQFRQIFTDALPGKAMPQLTNLFLNHQVFLTFLAILWPFLGTAAAIRSKKISTAIYIMVGLLFVIVLQIILNWVGLIMPMVSIDTTMSDVR